MNRVCIGVHVHAEPERLRATLSSLRTNTAQPFELLLLPDGADLSTRTFLATLSGVQQSATTEARGVAACFNRLATSTNADVLVLIESGAQVAPRWLEHLLAALEAYAKNGIAGPSTNNSWNEQCVFAHAGSTPAQIARAGLEAEKRFGQEARTLEPLYSLADFCYAVRREVVDAIGAADEAYGLGPCWEMDYNIRAARAGWRGVWACAAYVHRAPFTLRRRVEEAQRFEASKRLYQDKFCGARLRGEKADYRSHCRGDACSNFAPAPLIQLKKELHASSAAAVNSALSVTTVELAVVSEPLVSCIMPTSNRRSFVPQAIRSFLRQDYPNLELVVVDDGADSVRDCVPEHERVRYIRLDSKLTLGAKRNFACEQTSGEIIVHWDDDDWYPTWRVRAQVRAMLEKGSDISGSSRLFYFDAAANRAWEYRYAASRTEWVAGNTLAYRRTFWQRNRFPEIQVGEDSRFIWKSKNRSISDLLEPGLCVAMVHANNTSRKETRGSWWHPVSNEHIHSLLGDDLYFYHAPQDDEDAACWPMVSCIMPTFNRRAFVPHALRYFLQQDYPNRELIIVDDGDDGIGDLVKDMPCVSYLRLNARTSIGAKRNLACQHAQGSIIAHWDDDDWYSPDRLRYQAAPILARKADMTGLENSFVLELPGGEFWTTKPQLHKQLFVGNVHGGTLVYRKELLSQGLKYPEVNLAEDAFLLHRATRRGYRLMRLSNPGVFVYVRHGRNAWGEFAPGRFINPAGWQRIEQPVIFPENVLASYKSAARANERLHP